MRLLGLVQDFGTLFADSSVAVPISGGLLLGLAAVVARGSWLRHAHGAVPEAESLMNFSSLGTLRCVCADDHWQGEAVDRRQFCRSCGCEVVPRQRDLLTLELSSREIRRMTGTLRKAAVRASHLELPHCITTVEELYAYLDSSEPKNKRTPPTQPKPLEQPQVH